MQDLGRLKKIDVREAWVNESSDFTPWLATNIVLVGEAIGMQLELEARERNVGLFRADLLAKDIDTGNWVLIENQLEKTDHCHLGQLITYAAGLKAVTIVWVADQFTDEHRAALDWLNEITNESINFFGLEIELWQIGESIPAPKFNVKCQPNAWAKRVAGVANANAEVNAVNYYERVKKAMQQMPGASDRKLAELAGLGSGNTAKKYRLMIEAKREENVI